MIAFYDLQVSPVSFDVLHFLICAHHASQGPLHVVIVPGKREKDHKPISEAEKQWRVDHILVPAIRLSGATVTVAPTRSFAASMKAEKRFPDGYNVDFPSAHYTIGLAVDAIRNGAKVTFKATDRAKEHVSRYLGGRKNIVTLTMRQTHTPCRNSSLQAWEGFGIWLRNQGYTPIIIPDTEMMAKSPEYIDLERMDFGGPVETWALPACDLDIRLALYEAALLNMAASGGPFMLAMFRDLPAIFFLDVHKPDHVENGRKHWKPTADYMAHMGVPEGSQFPGGTTVWAPDTIDALKAAFENRMRMAA